MPQPTKTITYANPFYYTFDPESDAILEGESRQKILARQVKNELNQLKTPKWVFFFA